MLIKLSLRYDQYLSKAQAGYVESRNQAAIKREPDMDTTDNKRKVSGKITRITMPDYLERIPVEPARFIWAAFV